jgi:DNA-binding beta-propeller fold protein YncE
MERLRKVDILFCVGLVAMLAAVAISLSLPNVSLAAVESGALSQLPGPANCVGEEPEEPGTCGTKSQSGLTTAYQVAVSPDGKNVYSVALGGALVEYERSLASGALTVIGCITGVAPATCAPQNAQGGVTVVDDLAAIAISPDGENVYLIDQDKNMVVELSRNPETGLLSVMTGPNEHPECIAEGSAGECETTTAIGLSEPYGIAVSPDGTSLYATALVSGDVAEFSRDTETGTLEQIPGHECIGGESSGCPEHEANGLANAIGVVVSPGKGEDVYVAAGAKEVQSDVAAFARNESTGVLTQLAATEGCLGGVTGCTHGTAFDGVEDLAISPDGKNIYANSHNNDAVLELARKTSTPKLGELTQLAEPNACVSTEPIAKCTQVETLLGGPLGVAISPEGNNLYVDGSESDSVSAFNRNASTGALSLFSKPYECVTSNATECGENHPGSVELVGLGGVRRLAVSPDGTNVYVAAQEGNALVELARTITPEVSKIEPSEGTLYGGTAVQITGSGFAEGAKVEFGGQEATSVTVNSAGSITAVSPAGEKEKVAVSVTNPAGTSAPVVAAEYEYREAFAPSVTEVNPTVGFEGGGTEVAITGSEFGPEAEVDFGAVPALSVTVNSPHSITATSPPGAGLVNVTVTTNVGKSAETAAGQFQYQAGGLNLSGYCEAIGDDGNAGNPVVLTKEAVEGPQFAYNNWACVTDAGADRLITNIGPAPSMANACELAYPKVTTHAYPEDEDNAYSWGCHVTPSPGKEEEREREPEKHSETPPNAKIATSKPSTTTTTGAGTPAASIVPAPVLAIAGNVAPISGTVLVQLPGTKAFVPLSSLRQIPFGTVIEATQGHVSVTTAQPNGTTQTGEFFEGEFVLKQGRNGQVIAELTGGNFSVCPTARERAHKASATAAASHASGKHVVRKLWANAHGSFSTKGNYAAGAVQGTEWLTEDLCEGTLIRVTRDKVAVTNLVNHHHVEVKTGHKYLAKAP